MWQFIYDLDSAKIDGQSYPQFPAGSQAEYEAYEAAIKARRGLTRGVDDALLNLAHQRTMFVEAALKRRLGTLLREQDRYKIEKDKVEMGATTYYYFATNNPEHVQNLCYFSVLQKGN